MYTYNKKKQQNNIEGRVRVCVTSHERYSFIYLFFLIFLTDIRQCFCYSRSPFQYFPSISSSLAFSYIAVIVFIVMMLLIFFVSYYEIYTVKVYSIVDRFFFIFSVAILRLVYQSKKIWSYENFTIKRCIVFYKNKRCGKRRRKWKKKSS